MVESLMPDARAFFQSDLYIRHNARRLEHLAALQLDLGGKTVLELGAGIGDHSIFFLDRGCSVTAIEPRAENVEVIRARMQQLPGAWDPARLHVIQAAVEQLDAIDGLETYDVVHCYGLLYHVHEPRRVLESAAARCRGLFLLETKVRLPSHAAAVDEDRNNPTNSVEGPVTLLTRDELLAELARLLPHVYVPTVPVPHEQFPSDWDDVPPGQWPIRSVIVASRSPIDNPALRRYRA